MVNQCFKCQKYQKPNDFVNDTNPTNIPVEKQIVGIWNGIITTDEEAFPSCYICDDCYSDLNSNNQITENDNRYYIKLFT